MNINTSYSSRAPVHGNPVARKPDTSFSLDSGKNNTIISPSANLGKSPKSVSDRKIIGVVDRQGMLELGLVALGKSNTADWSNKGLNLSDDTLIAAAKALQDGFKKIVDEHGTATAGSHVSVNAHQIVINEQQQVPSWFSREYDNLITSISDRAHREAFRAGALVFASPPPL